MGPHAKWTDLSIASFIGGLANIDRPVLSLNHLLVDDGAVGQGETWQAAIRVLVCACVGSKSWVASHGEAARRLMLSGKLRSA